MDLLPKKKTLDVERGLFLISYQSAESENAPPRVTVTVRPGGEGDVDFITAPDADGPILWSPGACMIARVHRKTQLMVVVSPQANSASTAATVKMSALLADPAGISRRVGGGSSPLDLSQLRMVGHVAGIGDVVAGADGWIAGPMAPSRIEGFALEWAGRPQNIRLRYAARIGGPNLSTTALVDAGGFVGTKGRALPLLGAIFEISGAGAQGVQIIAEAIFLGSPQMRVSGERVVLSGPTGREPLVGLRVSLGRHDLRNSAVARDAVAMPDPLARDLHQAAPRQAQHSEAAVENEDADQSASPTVGSQPSRGAGKVRVFRSNRS